MHRHRRGAWVACLASMAAAVALTACGEGRPRSAAYPRVVDDVVTDARDASADYLVSQAVIEDGWGRVLDEKDLDRLEAPLARWSAEVTELVNELQGLRPPADAAEVHERLVTVQRDKRVALERLERAVDRRDVDAFDAALASADDADERDADVRAELEAAGYPLSFRGPTTELLPTESRDIARQRDRAYEVAVDNEAGTAADSSAESIEAQEELPEDEALAANPAALRDIAPPFEREASEGDAAADALAGIAPPDEAADLHDELVDAQRGRASAAADVADAARRRDLQAYQRAGARYERAAERQQTAVDDLDDAGYGFVALGSASDDAAEDEQHVARSG